MSTSDWSTRDLAYIGKICLSTDEYHHVASEEMKLLLVKFRTLGRQLHLLSEVLKTSGRSHEYYHDPELEMHVHSVRTDLENHFTRRETLNQKKIKKLHQYIDEHNAKVKDFNTEVMLLTVYKKLAFSQERPPQSRNELVTPDTAMTEATASDEEATGDGVEAGPSSRANLHVEDDTTSVMTEVTGAFKLARIVWAARANNYRPRQRPGASTSPTAPAMPRNDRGSTREQFVHDVIEVIKETRLYAEDTVPQEVLDKLTGIVSKAVRLGSTLTSPEISAQRNETSLLPETSTQQRTVRSLQIGGFHQNDPYQSRATSARPNTTFTLPDTVASSIYISDTGLPRISTDPQSLPASILTGLSNQSDGSSIIQRLSRDFDDSASSLTMPEPFSLGKPAMSTSSSSTSIIASSNSQNEAPSPLRPGPIEEEVDDTTDSRVLWQEGRQGWVKISSPQAGLESIYCNLEITESAGSICVDAIATPRPTTARSIEGSVQSRRTSARSMSFDNSPDGNIALEPSRTFKHLFTPDARPIPSVWHPRYEGPQVARNEPYTITFVEKQIFQEGGANRPLRRVADLKYIFSDKDYRDHVRSLIFGKELLASPGVNRISFHYIACGRQAVTLWFDKRTNQKTITFFRTSKDRKTRPHGEVEYDVLGIEDYKNAEDNEEPLVLFVKPLPDAETSEAPPKRANSFLSVISRHSTAPTILNESHRCSLFFSDVLGKSEFLSGLKGRQ